MMDTRNNIAEIDELIAGYFAQSLNKEELAELQQWLKFSNENRTYFLQAQELWFSAISANHAIRFNSEKAFQRFLSATIAMNHDSINEIPPKNRKRFFELNFLKVAAAVAVLMIVAGISYFVGSTGNYSQLADVTVEAPFGSKTKMYLPDGTLVWLNAGSRISYTNEFGINDRNVKLDGEGYFEVTKNADLAFKVATDEMNVQVLGTKFNFRNFDDDDESIITLIEGNVAVDNCIGSHKRYVLHPNQRIVLDKRTGKVELQKIDASMVNDWTKGLLSFDEDKLPDIVRELERTYNVEIEIKDDTLNQLRFYGNFMRGSQSIDEVLDVIASTGKLKYKKIERRFELRKK